MSASWGPLLLLDTCKAALVGHLNTFLAEQNSAFSLSLPTDASARTIALGDLMPTGWTTPLIQLTIQGAPAEIDGQGGPSGAGRHTVRAFVEARIMLSDGDVSARTTDDYYRAQLAYGAAVQRCIESRLDPAWALANSDALGTAAWVWRTKRDQSYSELVPVGEADAGQWMSVRSVVVEILYHEQRDNT